MEQRKADRVEIKGEVNGKIILVEHIEILDISMTGIRCYCYGRVEMQSVHRIKIEKDCITLNLKGRVVRSTLRKTGVIDGKNMPVYEMAIHFEAVPDGDIPKLLELIRIFENG